MNNSTRDLWLTLGVLFAALLLHFMTPFFPLLFTVPVALVFFLDRPWPALLLFAFMMELLSFSAMGVVSGIVLVPFILIQLVPTIRVDFSFSYLFFLVTSVFVQMLILLVHDYAGMLPILFSHFPLVVVLSTLCASVALLFVSTVLYHFNVKGGS